MRLKYCFTAAATAGILGIVALQTAVAGDDEKRRYSPPPPYQGPTGSTSQPGVAERLGYTFAPAAQQPPQLLVPRPSRSKSD